MTMDNENRGPRHLRLRYSATCVGCGIRLSKGSEAVWDPGAKTATCLACEPSGGPLPNDAAGQSASVEGDRRAAMRVEAVRRRYGDHAAVAETMAGLDAYATWEKGSEGEGRLAAWVGREVGDSVIALHDRLLPGTRGNIDHVFVAASGVWVVDAKA